MPEIPVPLVLFFLLLLLLALEIINPAYIRSSRFGRLPKDDPLPGQAVTATLTLALAAVAASLR